MSRQTRQNSQLTGPSTNQPQPTAWTTRLECCTSSGPTRKRDASLFGKRRCDWLCRGGVDIRSHRPVILPAERTDEKRIIKNFEEQLESFNFVRVVLVGERRDTVTMPKSFSKVHKQISKKRGVVEALHENSRDAKRLRRANTRDDRVARVQAKMSRGRNSYRMSCSCALFPLYGTTDMSIVERVLYFQEHVPEGSGAFSDDDIRELVTR